MSSASAGSVSDNSGEKNFAQVPCDSCPSCGHPLSLSCTSAVSAEAEQGDGPAAASATSSAVSGSMVSTSAVSVCVGGDYASAACDYGVVAVGPSSAAAVGRFGAVAVGPTGAVATDPASVPGRPPGEEIVAESAG